MALDRQRILSELGSVVNQLQSANCGCLGNLFEKSTPTHHQYPSHGHAQPTCGGHHGCNRGHGPNMTRNSCRAPCSSNYQRHGSCMSDFSPQKLFAGAQNYLNTNIVEPIVKEVNDEMKSITPENTVANSPLAFQMGLPCSPPKPQDNQQGFGQNNFPKQSMANPGEMQMSDFVAMVNNHMQPNHLNEQGDRTQGVMDRNRITPQSTNSPQMLSQASYGRHAQGMEKFKEMFPGIMGKGDLGFDPMNVAMAMNPAYQNAGMAKSNINQLPKVFSSSGQPIAPQTLNSSPDNTYTYPTPMAKSNAKLIPTNASENPHNNQPAYAQNINSKSLYPNDQQIHYAMSGQPMSLNQVTNDPSSCILPTISETLNTNPIVQENRPVTQTTPETVNYKHLLNPLILPVETYNSPSGIPPSYEFNTLGQPVEKLPAKVYHYPEPNLPQTLSPQPTMKPRYSNVKSTVSKTSLTGNKAIGKSYSRSNLQRMYNEYKGSQSFIPPKSTPQGVTHSEGKLNVTDLNKNSNKYFERTGGDTVLNNATAQKPETVGQIGDVPATNNPKNSTAEKLSPATGRNYRNGLQDITYTSYPMSTAWSFHH